MNKSENNVVFTPGDDPEMENAAKLARKTFRFYWREMSWEHRRIVPGLEVSSVKVSFSDPPEMRSTDPGALEVEHMWMSDVTFNGHSLSGTLQNSPHSLKSVSEGDTITFSPRQVNDWMYAIRGRAYGGFTVNLMRARMAKGERKQHDNAWGLDFGDPANVLVVPADFLSDKPAKSGGLFAKFTGKPKETPQDYEAVGRIEHPMSVNMRESLDEALVGNPAMLSEPDDDGLTFLHQLSLAGSTDGVNVLIRRGADVSLRTKKGLSALKMAKLFRWEKVAKLLQAAGTPE